MERCAGCPAKTLHISDCEITPDGQHAGQYQVCVGARQADGRVRRDPSRGRRRAADPIHLIDALSVETRLETDIDLALAGMNETRLHYHSLLAVDNRAVRMCHLFRDLIEEQADHILQEVKVKAEQRRLADERLLS